MSENRKKPKDGYRIMDTAYIRHGDILYTDESVILACLLHTHSMNRKSKDMTDLRRIMKDHNLEAPIVK